MEAARVTTRRLLARIEREGYSVSFRHNPGLVLAIVRDDEGGKFFVSGENELAALKDLAWMLGLER